MRAPSTISREPVLFRSSFLAQQAASWRCRLGGAFKKAAAVAGGQKQHVQLAENHLAAQGGALDCIKTADGRSGGHCAASPIGGFRTRCPKKAMILFQRRNARSVAPPPVHGRLQHKPHPLHTPAPSRPHDSDAASAAARHNRRGACCPGRCGQKAPRRAALHEFHWWPRAAAHAPSYLARQHPAQLLGGIGLFQDRNAAIAFLQRHILAIAGGEGERRYSCPPAGRPPACWSPPPG